MLDVLDDYIHGDKFSELGQYKIDTNDFIIDSNRLKQNMLVYVKTDKILDFFDQVKDLPYNYIIITHNSDHNITEEIYKHKPKNILHWFAQNCLVPYNDVTPIPIGLERPGVGGSGDINVLKRNIVSSSLEKNILCYTAFSPSTNPEARNFHKREWEYREIERVSFEDYINKLSKSRFTLAPPGNGHDCHRTWEALYLGTIPIVIDSECNRGFKNVLRVDSFNSIKLNSETLLATWFEYEGKIDTSELRFSYWKKLILDKVNDLLK